MSEAVLDVSPLRVVLELLDVEDLGSGLFRGRQPDERPARVFGGQIAAQALMSASRTVEDRSPHSLHAYFLRPGDVSVPAVFSVTALRDGNTFSARRVSAIQHGEVIFEALVSFSSAKTGPEYQAKMPEVPAPEKLTPIEQLLAPYSDEYDGWWVRPRAFDLRYVSTPPRLALEQDRPRDRTNRLWMRANGRVSADPVLAACLVTYISDLTLLDPVLVAAGRTSRGPGLTASLDHAIWFQRPADVNDWILYDQCSPSAVDGRGVASASMYDRTGKLICLVNQEGYLGGAG